MLGAVFPVLEKLRADGIEFVVIGGVAVVVHGVVRTTKDVDIVPEPTVDNLVALGNCLVSLDARSTSRPDLPFGPNHHDALLKGKSMTLSTSLGDLDVVQRLAGVPPYAVLADDALAVTLPSGTAVKVTSLAHLRTMKLSAGRPQDLVDLEDLPDSDAP